MLELAEQEGAALTTERWHEVLEEEALSAPLRRAAHQRLRLLDRVSGSGSLWDLVEPGVMTVFVLGDARLGPREALPLLVALLSGLSQPSARHGSFQRLFLLDEVNRFDRDALLWQHLVQAARQIRHRGSTLVLCGQDFLWLPEELWGLCTLFGLFRVRSQRLYDHVRERQPGYGCWSFAEVSQLRPGEAVVAAAEATDPAWRAWAQRMYFRPLRCEHGGRTRAEL